MTGITRDEKRVFNKLDGWDELDRETSLGKRHIGMPVPVNIGISMSILTSYQTDMDQILSNFIPYNNPYIVLSWAVPGAFNIRETTEIRSTVHWSGSINTNYPIELEANAKPRIGSDTTFTIEGWLFPAAPIDSNLPIFFINNNFHLTDFAKSGKLITYDDFDYLKDENYDLMNLITSTEVASVSGSPIITNIILQTENGREEIYDSTTLSTTDNTITLLGKGFDYTTTVMLSSSNSSLMQNLTALDFTYYPSITGFPIDTYKVMNKNILTIKLPELHNNDKFSVIVASQVGWDTTISKNITFTLNHN